MYLSTFAQTAPNIYFVVFSDKNNSSYSLAHPEQFLSKKAIEKRLKWGIPFDWKDLPVSSSYIQSLNAIDGCQVHVVSKWFNAATVVITALSLEQSILDQINSLPFVSEVKKARAQDEPIYLDSSSKWLDLERSSHDEDRSIDNQYLEFYGPSFTQVSMINAHVLHELGFSGEGVDVALFDSGWLYADQLPAFDRLRERSAIIKTRDFVKGGENVYTNSTHGTYVLSTMAGWIPDSLIGTAPDANYYLFKTEDVDSEYLIEEDNWVAAAELADSLGIDIINSSLGYSEFDDPFMNYSYDDMNGEVSRASIAGDIAASKGILVINSAGNRGNDVWRYITAPSDGDSVLCVGAVTASKIRAWFSGFGPSSDGDVKPNVMTMGRSAVFADLDSTIRTGNGTSFSSPIMAGGAACLWQAVNERKTNMEIFRAIERSADHYNSPSDSLGYGIPDLWKALQLLNEEWNADLNQDMIAIFPNPAHDHLTIATKWLQGSENIEIHVYDISGKKVEHEKYMLTVDVSKSVVTLQWRVGELVPGNYLIQFLTDKENRLAKFIVR